MTDHKDEIDSVTGTATTGHQWDGIKELNTPLPRWWIITFYATIVWAVAYWIVYPAWPLVQSYTTGVIRYSSRADVAVELVQQLLQFGIAARIGSRFGESGVQFLQFVFQRIGAHVGILARRNIGVASLQYYYLSHDCATAAPATYNFRNHKIWRPGGF